MFSTVIGSLPQPSSEATPAESVLAAIEAQEAAGLDLLSAGAQPPAADLDAEAVVEAWRTAAGGTHRPVKQTLIGPWTTARREATGTRTRGAAVAAAERLRALVDALAEAGCPLVEIDEPDAVHIGASAPEREAFRAAHVRLAADAPLHLTLVLTGGNVDRAGPAVFLDPPYASYALDLVAGPDNWRLVTEIPGDRGVVCGALSAETGTDDGPELLVWAVHYAASTGRRGLERVGLANASSLAALTWDQARRKLERLGEAARIAALPRTGELAAALDPRATDLKSRALGRRMGKGRTR